MALQIGLMSFSSSKLPTTRRPIALLTSPPPKASLDEVWLLKALNLEHRATLKSRHDKARWMNRMAHLLNCQQFIAGTLVRVSSQGFPWLMAFCCGK
jgi:hypothetical protein